MKGVFLAILFFAVATYVYGANWYVDASRPDDLGTGGSWEEAKQTIQSAVDVASSGDTIWVTNGIYVVTNGEIHVTNAITIQSINGSTFTSVDGGGTNRCFNLSNACCTITGFTITNGLVHHKYGGGIYCYDQTPIISNCVISGNVAYYGGGIYGGTLVQCHLIENEGCRGGGAYSSLVEKCTFTSNKAGRDGGGAYHCTLSRCFLVSNTAVRDYYEFPSENEGEGGGACGGELYNCLLLHNTANDGGGVARALLNNCTVINNTTERFKVTSLSSGGGAYYCTLKNCIVWDNKADRYLNASPSSMSNCCSPDAIDGENGNTTATPFFMNPDAGDYRLSVNSPCINAGSTYTNISSIDLDGNSRIVFDEVDIGAYEQQDVWVAPATATSSICMTLRSAMPLTGLTDVCVGELGAVGVLSQSENTVSFTLPEDCVLGMNYLELWFDQQMRKISNALCCNGTRYVDASSPNDSGDGLSWSTAKRSIQSAVDASFDGDMILVTNGTYAWEPTQNTSDVVNISCNLYLKSINGQDTTIIDGAGTSRCVRVRSPAIIEGFSFVNGKAGSGAGVYSSIDSANVILNNCMFMSNNAGSGGGVYGATLNNCVLMNNRAYTGGGAYEAYLNNSSLVDNKANGNGGGASRCTLNSCILMSNSAYQSGGGVYWGTLNNCILVGNRAYISERASEYTEYNQIGYGGGAYLSGLRNCTLINNMAYSRGGGVDRGGLNNCILWGNTTSNDYDNISYASAMYTCSPDGITNGINGCITNNPLFVDVENNNFHLQENSPCINAGNNIYAPTNVSLVDLDGNPRILHGTVDMGAYEWGKGMVMLQISSGKHGSVDPVGSVSVLQGGEKSFYLYPENWYMVSDVLTNGYSSGLTGISEFVWSNIQTDGTLHIEFTEQTTVHDTPLWWLAEYGMTQNVEIADSQDQDGDGMLTWQEYCSDTDPTNNASVLIAQTGVDVNGSGASNEVVLKWLSGTNMSWRYQILCTTNLLDYTSVATNLLPSPPINSYTVTVNGARSFFKIEAER